MIKFIKKYLMLRLIKKYRKEHPDYDEYFCAFAIRNSGKKMEDFVNWFSAVHRVDSFLPVHGLVSRNHGIFTSRDEYNLIYREYMIDWIEDQVKKM